MYNTLSTTDCEFLLASIRLSCKMRATGKHIFQHVVHEKPRNPSPRITRRPSGIRQCRQVADFA